MPNCAELKEIGKQPTNPKTIKWLQKIKTTDNGESLIDIKKAIPDIFIDLEPIRLKKEKSVYARQTVIKMLKIAQTQLPNGYRLRINDAWRPFEEQKRYYQLSLAKRRRQHPKWTEKQVIEETNKWTFPPDSGIIPYHCTGGAIDLQICYPSGRSLPFWSKKDPLPKRIVKNRQLLKAVMENAGFSNYPFEWWHFSYGDSGWALRTGRLKAFYGAVDFNIDK